MRLSMQGQAVTQCITLRASQRIEKLCQTNYKGVAPPPSLGRNDSACHQTLND